MMHVIWSGLKWVLGRGTWMCLLECESGTEHAGFGLGQWGEMCRRQGGDIFRGLIVCLYFQS